MARRTDAVERSLEPILGWRTWRLVRARGGLRIAPATPREPWEPGVAQRATCTGAHTRLYLVFNPELAPTHRSPEPGCTCGFHAFKEPARLGRTGRGVGVVGQVAMWGRVIEHTRGWRAEFVYPARLRLACARCLWWGRLPAIPDLVVVRGDRLLPACREHGARLRAREALPVREVEAELLDTYRVELLPVELLGRAGADPITSLLRLLDPRRR
ncbi:MAG TPA: hypothetical protein VNP94_01400 [Actinomycetota bacterium]|nr:hypothetical protein [Actinomycetota bacterium]